MAAFCKLFTQTARQCQTWAAGLMVLFTKKSSRCAEVGRKSPSSLVFPLPPLWYLKYFSQTATITWSCLTWDRLLKAEDVYRTIYKEAHFTQIVSDACWATLTFSFRFSLLKHWNPYLTLFDDCCHFCRSSVHSNNFPFYCSSKEEMMFLLFFCLSS